MDTETTAVAMVMDMTRMIKQARIALMVGVSLLLSPVLSAYAADDPAIQQSPSSRTEAFGAAVKRDTKALGAGIKEGAHRVAVASKAVGHEIAVAAKHSAHETRAAFRGEKTSPPKQ